MPVSLRTVVDMALPARSFAVVTGVHCAVPVDRTDYTTAAVTFTTSTMVMTGSTIR